MTNAEMMTKPSVPPIVQLRERLDQRMSEIRAALPPDITPSQFLRAVMTSASINPEILACSWQSVWLACLQACRDGLLPDGVEGAIVPYKSRATWIPMFQGLLRRFRRSGQFRWVTAGLVREGEEFEHYISETGEHFRHRPGDDFEAPITYCYALATTKDDGVFVTVMPIAEANKIRNFSKNTREDGPWQQWSTEMYKKTALRRLSKMLPSARDLIPPSEAEPPQLDGDPAAPVTESLAPPRPLQQGPTAALNHFAGNEQTPASAMEEPTGRADAGGDVPAADDAQRVPVPDTMTTAWERGRDWRAKGNARKAVPMEYRDEDHQREAAAWQAGFDGKPMPAQQEIGL
jgi:recombination protein RecT